MKKNIKSFFEDGSKWHKEYNYLREVILDTDLKEEFKWGKPCYTFQGDNIVLVHGFKEYCAILFHKGVLLDDSEKLLIQQTENVQAARQMRFSNLKEIEQKTANIKAYIFEAIEVEKEGLEVEMKETSDFEMADEFQEALDKDLKLKSAFENLTPGRQRGYLLYFSGAKQSSTRESRVEQCTQKIYEGRGLNDR